ncbi:hypothetical protein [Sanguibacter sp. HDW7]|uniref:hypothetical protein n=1 Tax=Sanguibacter sp. HDW7 TaxID=2714931 RepID=UPI00140D9D6B|nr:hypothetical protein [Sanguibacter sp. HDW7]QIK83090.1 hypothetical protein G7063_05210 [Sanguibacter sp. HDW7]
MTVEHVTLALVAAALFVIGYLLGTYERRRTATWRLAAEIADALDDYELMHAMQAVDEAVAPARALYVARALTGADPPDLSRLDIADGITPTAPTKETP